jgi:hypothetical protein
MAKRIKMIVGDEVFPTKKALIERCREILYKHPLGESLDAEETEFLTSLIERYHPEGEMKIGCGITRMWAGSNEYGGTGFYLEREDGSTTDWSFMKSINHPSKKHDFDAACRNAIMDQTIDFKRRQFASGLVECELTGERLTSETAHTDHKPPRTFENLLKVFLKKTGIDFNDVAIDPTYDNKVGCWLSDKNFAERWQRFHKANAEFRIVSRTGNLSVSKREANAMK